MKVYDIDVQNFVWLSETWLRQQICWWTFVPSVHDLLHPGFVVMFILCLHKIVYLSLSDFEFYLKFIYNKQKSVVFKYIYVEIYTNKMLALRTN